MNSLVDVNVSLGHWPWMEFSWFSLDCLCRRMRENGISHSLVSSIGSIFYPDPDVPDEQLFASLDAYPQLLPVKTVNLAAPNWRESLEWGLRLGARMVRIIPSYHMYSLIDQPTLDLGKKLIASGIPLAVQMRIEDERNQYPLLKVEPPQSAFVAQLASLLPELKIVALCANRREVADFTEVDNLYVETSFLDGGATPLGTPTAPDRLLLGTHSPFLCPTSARLKVKAAKLEAQIKASTDKLLKGLPPIEDSGSEAVAKLERLEV